MQSKSFSSTKISSAINGANLFVPYLLIVVDLEYPMNVQLGAFNGSLMAINGEYHICPIFAHIC